MNRVLREKYGGRVWAVVVDNLVVETYKYVWSQDSETRRYFTHEPRYLTREGIAVEFVGPEDLYPSKGEAEAVAMTFVLFHSEYMDHIEVVNVNERSNR